MSDFTGLTISGRIATPSDPDWDEARAAWNLIADQHPEAVALVESAEDIAATVRFAAQHDLRVAGQGTGHGAAPLGPLEGTILIKTERMRGSRSTRTRAPPGSRQACSRPSSASPPASTGSAPCQAPRPTSARSATRSVAA